MLTQYELKQLFHTFASMHSMNISGTIYVPIESAMTVICSYLDPALGVTANFSVDRNNLSLKWEPINAVKEKSDDKMDR